MNDTEILTAIDAAITDDDGTDDEGTLTLIACLLGLRVPATV